MIVILAFIWEFRLYIVSLLHLMSKTTLYKLHSINVKCGINLKYCGLMADCLVQFAGNAGKQHGCSSNDKAPSFSLMHHAKKIHKHRNDKHGRRFTCQKNDGIPFLIIWFWFQHHALSDLSATLCSFNYSVHTKIDMFRNKPWIPTDLSAKMFCYVNS